MGIADKHTAKTKHFYKPPILEVRCTYTYHPACILHPLYYTEY